MTHVVERGPLLPIFGSVRTLQKGSLVYNVKKYAIGLVIYVYMTMRGSSHATKAAHTSSFKRYM